MGTTGAALRGHVVRSGASGEGRFPAGTLIGGRYRIIGLAGRGGMGEVYQATDLKLAQPVALKFLPEAESADPAALKRLSNEVRIARQVTHPNVCRVYDIGEVEGLHYISMEFIDGENLASLLRRIGRVPPDKALEMTRRLCAGLAAAHDKGILHRDLKPGNVMIDGAGQVRIADFGLAGLARQFQPAERQSGTPQYMAPEQLRGRGASIQTDIYALGLVLYELFTGRRPFEAPPGEQPTPPTRPSEIVNELDARTEGAILSCLDPDPRRRPSSARAIAASLPGSEPLAAALAAGATPSPELVALSGEVEGLSVASALACLMAVLGGLAAMLVLCGRTSFLERVQLEKSPDALAQESADWIRRLGYPKASADRAYGFAYANDALSYVEGALPDPVRWARAAAARPAPLIFWYRESPRFLETSAFSSPPGLVSQNTPYPAVPGMIGLTLDPRGRLLSFYAIAPQWEESNAAIPPEPDDTRIFDAAGLDASRFVPSRPKMVPAVAFDTRRAWAAGPHADEPDRELRLEAAYWRGRATFIKIAGPWSNPRYPQATVTLRGRIAVSGIVLVFLALLAGGAVVARHNVLAKRSDQRGAVRLAGFVFGLEMVIWCFGASHVPTLWEAGLLILGLGQAAYTAGLTWLLYLALEPFVRRRWPQTLISWARVLSGHFRDPLVGAHLLIGTALGTVAAFLFQAALLWNSGVRLTAMAGAPSTAVLLGGRHIVQQLAFYLNDGVSKAMTQLFLIFVLRLIVRRTEAAVALTTAVLTFLAVSWTPPGGTEVAGRSLMIPAVMLGAGITLVISALTRFGLLTAVMAMFTVSVLTEFPITTDLSSWYFGTAVAGIIVIVGSAVFAYGTAAAGRKWLAGIIWRE